MVLAMCRYGYFWTELFCLQQVVKLGANLMTDVKDCTHIVVDCFKRTEKLLCAMAVASAIVTVRWAKDCSSKKIILRAFFFLSLGY
jgi:hypothetical protein